MKQYLSTFLVTKAINHRYCSSSKIGHLITIFNKPLPIFSNVNTVNITSMYFTAYINIFYRISKSGMLSLYSYLHQA